MGDQSEWTDGQLLALKVGVSLLVVLLSAVWYCWNRFQRQITTNVSLAHNILHQSPAVPKVPKVLREVKNKISNKFREYRSGLLDDNEREPIFGVPRYSRSGRKLRQHERAMILASKFINMKKEPIRFSRRDMPENMLGPDVRDIEERLPEEINMMYKTVRVFGHFDKPVFLSLCKHMVVETLQQGDYLFRRGQKDEWIYVIQSGRLSLLALYEGQEYSISEIGQGESIASLLSVLDVLTGDLAVYKTVSAVALEESIIIKLPAEAISKEFLNYPASLVRIVQMITLRLQRVTFLALHDYLGLSEELINPNAMTSLKRSNSRRSTNSLSSDDLTKPTMTKKDSFETEMSSTSEVSESPQPKKRSMSFMKARFNQLEQVINDDGTVYNRHSSEVLENNNADFAASVERAFSRESVNSPEMVFEPVSGEDIKGDDLTDGVDALATIFGLDDGDLITKRVQMYKIKQGHVISAEGDQDPALYYVVSGRLVAEQEMGERKSVLYEAVPGSLSGQLSVLTGEPTFFKTYAKSDSIVLRMTKVDFYSLMADYPKVVLNLAHTVVSRLSPFVRQIDFALDWVLVEAGKPLYTQNDMADCLYIVLNGRLRSVKQYPNGRKEMVCEFGRSECVGLVDSYTNQPRSTSVHAIRDTEVARIPSALMHHIKRLYPNTVTNIISLMTDQVIHQKFKNDPTSQRGHIFSNQHNSAVSNESEGLSHHTMANHLANISTVAVLSTDNDVPLGLFTSELAHVLKKYGATQRLTSETVKKRLGEGAMDLNNEYRLTTWLGQQEDVHKMTLYQCDSSQTNWTNRCLRQADCILIVAMGQSKPKIGELELELEKYACRALKCLVLLHKENVEAPTRTAEWLNLRGWLTNHFHVKIPSLMLNPKAQRFRQELISKIRQSTESTFSDFSRLARFLTGNSVALVLGGGGARGISQIGIIDSLRKKNIPIDMIGGTSIGSFMGALWAQTRDIDVMKKRTKRFSGNMSQLWRKIIDLTYPITAMFSGKGLNNEIRSILGDTQIEDLWIPYFCITTDLSASRMRVHSFGSLWRYVRGSMTLTGYMPPICDPLDGHYLVDGGYINNLPGDVAKARGASVVVAVDVGARDSSNLYNYGDSISGWWLLWKKWWPWTESVRVPDLNDVQSRLAYIACSHLLEEVIGSDYCFYIRNDEIQKFKTLDFDRFDEILEFGYEFAQSKITDEWVTSLNDKNKESDDHKPILKRKAGWQKANSDFIDLAQYMVKIPKANEHDNDRFKRPFFSECSDNDDGFIAAMEINSDSEIMAREKRHDSL